MLRTCIKQIDGSNSGRALNGEFSYIISSWLMEEGQEVRLVNKITLARVPAAC